MSDEDARPTIVEIEVVEDRRSRCSILETSADIFGGGE